MGSEGAGRRSSSSRGICDLKQGGKIRENWKTDLCEAGSIRRRLCILENKHWGKHNVYNMELCQWAHAQKVCFFNVYYESSSGSSPAAAAAAAPSFSVNL